MVNWCFQKFLENFPGVAVLEAIFLWTLSYVTKLFRETGCVDRISGSRTLTKPTLKMVMDDNSHTSLRRKLKTDV